MSRFLSHNPTKSLKHVIRFLKFNKKNNWLTYPILVNSIPKSGTNLLKNMVLAIPGTHPAGGLALAAEKHDADERLRFVQEHLVDLQPGQVYTGHIPYSVEIADWLHQHSIKHLFIYRDPRDYTVSLYHYIMKRDIIRGSRGRHAYYEMFAGLGNDSDRLMGAIQGIGPGQTDYRVSPASFPNVKLMYDAFMNWSLDENTFALRYEELVGEKAGQPKEKTTALVKAMLHYLGLPVNAFDDTLLHRIIDQGMSPSKSRTFRRGGSGAWREEYTEQHIQLFCLIAGDLLTTLGYSWE